MFQQMYWDSFFWTYLRILLEVLFQDDVLAKLLVVVLERRPGVEVRGLCEAGHVVL